jgi:hypothetical protein
LRIYVPKRLARFYVRAHRDRSASRLAVGGRELVIKLPKIDGDKFAFRVW